MRRSGSRLRDDENTVASHRGAEIDFLHDGVAADVVWQSLGDLSAEIKKDDLVYQPHHEFRAVFDQQNCHPRSSQRAEKNGQVPLFRLSKAGGRGGDLDRVYFRLLVP